MPKTISRHTSPPKTNKRPAARRSAGKPSADKQAPEGQRIAKIIARAGLCSRRDAEAWIAEGRVAVNGKVLDSPALNVGPKDQISVDGKPLVQRQRTRLFLFHKPRGLVTTNKDPEGRATIFDYLQDHAPDAPRLMSIGRLDINTEGLLLLTNDGGLARILELPTTGWLRRYRVRANGETHQGVLDELAKGITIDGIRYAGIEATFERQQGANCWLTMGLREGKNREIKRVLEHLGLTVNRLIRVSYGPFQLGDLGEGKIEEVRTRVLRDQLGHALAEEAGVDFDSPAEIETEEERGPERGRPERGRPERGRPERPAAKGGRNAPRAKRAMPEPEEPVKHRPQAGPRKHISTLRAQDAERDGSARRRIETSETKDRKGRAVAIERRVAVKPEHPQTKPYRGDAPARASSRPQRERSEWGSEARPARNAASSRTQRSEAHQKSDRPRSDRFKSERPASDRPRSDRPNSDRPRSDKPRTDRTNTDRYKSDRPKSDRPKSDRPKSDRPRSDKPKTDWAKSDRPKTDRPKSERSKSERSKSAHSKSDRFKSDRPNRKPSAIRSPAARGRTGPNKKPRGRS